MAWEVRKSRASGAPGVRFAVEWLGEDNDGGWVLIPALTAHVEDPGGWVVAVQVNPVLGVFPVHGTWVASTSHAAAKVDLCRWASVEPGRLRFEDVELDVVWRWGEPARIEDVEEFDALELPPDEAGQLMAAAERIRSAADAGTHPFGPAFRDRLVAAADNPDPRLALVWTAGVRDHLAADVARFLGHDTANHWFDRQRAGDGWLLCGGQAGEVIAVVWLADGRAEHVAAASTAKADALIALLRTAGPELSGFPSPPLSRRLPRQP